MSLEPMVGSGPDWYGGTILAGPLGPVVRKMGHCRCRFHCKTVFSEGGKDVSYNLWFSLKTDVRCKVWKSAWTCDDPCDSTAASIKATLEAHGLTAFLKELATPGGPIGPPKSGSRAQHVYTRLPSTSGGVPGGGAMGVVSGLVSLLQAKSRPSAKWELSSTSGLTPGQMAALEAGTKAGTAKWDVEVTSAYCL